MKLSQTIIKAINTQIKNEFDNAFLYLSIASWCEENNLSGFAKWNLAQFKEEQKHAMKFYNYVFERQGKVDIMEVEQPKQKWNNIVDVFEDVVKREEETTTNIYKLYEIAKNENDYTTLSFLQWFLEEQVEEESTANTILSKLKMIGDSRSALMCLDAEAGKR